MNELERTIEMYRKMHERRHAFKGKSTMRHVDSIKRLIKKTNAKTLLDYGCGKGSQYTKAKIHEKWGGIMPTLYDPGVREFEEKPEGEFDGVLCVDVMEHIPENHVKEVLSEIMCYARKFVFFNISTALAKKYLPDGRNVHLTVRPKEWWRAIIRELTPQGLIVVTDFDTPKYNDPRHVLKKRL